MNVFFDIQKDTQVDLVSNWLALVDLRKLDTAVSFSKYHKVLLEVFKAPECIFNSFSWYLSGLEKWMVLRKLKAKRISLDIEVLADEKTRNTMMTVLGPSLQSLELKCMYHAESCEDENDILPSEEKCISTGNIITDIVKYCPVLESLRVVQGQLDANIADLILKNRHLKSIDLSHCSRVSSAILDAICRSPWLEEIALAWCRFHSDAFSFMMPAPGSNHTCTTLSMSDIDGVSVPLAFVRIFANVKTLSVQVESVEELIRIAQQCSLVTTACIHLFGDSILLSQAKAIATSWPQIESLKIIVVSEAEYFYAEDGLVVAFLDNCTSLRQLRLLSYENEHLYEEAYSRYDLSPSAEELEILVREKYSHLKHLEVMGTVIHSKF